jgi:hypothetical protein
MTRRCRLALVRISSPSASLSSPEAVNGISLPVDAARLDGATSIHDAVLPNASLPVDTARLDGPASIDNAVLLNGPASFNGPVCLDGVVHINNVAMLDDPACLDDAYNVDDDNVADVLVGCSQVLFQLNADGDDDFDKINPSQEVLTQDEQILMQDELTRLFVGNQYA